MIGAIVQGSVDSQEPGGEKKRAVPEAAQNANTIYNISAVDGRYKHIVEPLAEYFSEYAYIRFRVEVEVNWLLFLKLPQQPVVSSDDIEYLTRLYKEFKVSDACDIKDLEKVTNHDVKAIEYWIRNRVINNGGLEGHSEFIHWGLTSEDVNNTAHSLMHSRALADIILPAICSVEMMLVALMKKHKASPLLARTHGQPASPTTFGKEMAVYLSRLSQQKENASRVQYVGKFNGATGNYSAMLAALPSRMWPEYCRKFIEENLGLKFQEVSTQIECHDTLAGLYGILSLVCSICIDLCTDMWLYISNELVTLAVVKTEVGSSTMPHKVNPIHFENAEANFGVASALFQHLGRKLPVSRLQRDLSDSSTMRAVGTAMGHMLVALNSLNTGLGRISFNEAAAMEEINGRYELLGEPIQTVMRMYGIEGSYDALKDLTRGHPDQLRERLNALVTSLEDKLPTEALEKLKALSPESYIGLAEYTTESVLKKYDLMNKDR